MRVNRLNKNQLIEFLGNTIIERDKLKDQNKELIEENSHLQNYAFHTEFCSWKFNGNAKCDCGYIKTNKK